MKTLKVLFAASLFVILFYACRKDKEMDHSSDINEYIAGLSLPQTDPEVNPPLAIGDPIDSLIYGETCTVQKYRWAPGNEQPLLLNPTTDVIFPGNVLGAESITKGKYTPITGDRAPITMSISLSNLSGNVSATAPTATLSQVREAIQSILDNEVTGATPAAIAYEISQVHSSEQLKVAIGANFGTWFTDISSSFNFNSSEKMSRYLVKFFQVYYSIDIDIPQRPSDLWNVPPSVSAFDGMCPVYVSSVKYGRMALCTFESNASAESIKAALEASFGGFLADGGITVSTAYQEIINSSKKKVFIFGGSGGNAAPVTDFGTLRTYINEGGNYSKNSPGAPLAYTLRFLKDNSIARIVLSSEYNVAQCEPVPVDPTVKPVTVNPSTMSKLYPKHVLTGADNDFGGNGAKIKCKASLEISADRKHLMLYIDYTAGEPGGDWTKGEQRAGAYPNKDSHGRYEWAKRVLYTAPSGWKIKSIDSEETSSLSYWDQDYSIDVYRRSSEAMSGGLVNEFQSLGSINGPDLTDSGAGSYISLIFNPVHLTINK